MTPQEAIKILKPLFEHCKGKNECLGYIEHFFTKDEEEALDMAIKALEQQPKIGHWTEEEVFDGELGYRCSECGELFWLESGTPKDNECNFCPKCGAKMVESEDKK